MDDWLQEDQQVGERILAQSAALFSQREDSGAVELLLCVKRLGFEQTSDEFVTTENWHDYFWAAVFFVGALDITKFSEERIQHILPTLIEVASQNGKLDVDRIYIKPLLPEFDATWRETLARRHTRDPIRQAQRFEAEPAAQSRITPVTRRRIFDVLRSDRFDWTGGLDEIAFLERLYDLDVMESFDSRFRTAREDIIQHCYNNPGDWERGWIFNDSRFGLDCGPDQVILRFLAEIVHPEVCNDQLEAECLVELFNEALVSDGYVLVQCDAISGHPVYEGQRIRSSRPDLSAVEVADDVPTVVPFDDSIFSAPASPGDYEPGCSVSGEYESVRKSSRGERKDYALDRVRMDVGGQAEVFRAVHKKSQTEVAFKRLLSRRATPIARMCREIEVANLFNGHPNFMPILDFSAAHDWFVMPLAEATAEKHRNQLQEPQNLHSLISSVGAVLAVAHGSGWLHRDIKPSNILLLKGRWTLGDWGIVRRPRGQTTHAGRTGFYLGTEGFAAPELFVAPHDATPSSDIYSLGRVIAWALTGDIPQTNIPLLPQPGPWRNIVRAATQLDAQNRPQSIDEFLSQIDRELSEPPLLPIEHAETLLASANSGNSVDADRMLSFFVDNPDNYEFYVRLLTKFHVVHAGPALARGIEQAKDLMHSMINHVGGDGVNWVQFSEAASAVTWLHSIAVYADDSHEWELLEHATRAMCVWDGSWDQWNPQRNIRTWLRSLRGSAANVVAAVLRDHPNSAINFSSLADDQRVDRDIRRAVHVSGA